MTNFDTPIDRSRSYATQYEELEEKFGRTDLLPLWIADMDFAVPDAVTDALRDRIGHPVLGYTTAPASFWHSITGWLGRRWGLHTDRADIDYIPGVKKGLGLAVTYFTRPGDRVLIQPPVYHSFRSVVAGNGRVPVDNPLICEDGRYRMDFEGLERVIRETKPAMMLLCNPHNPVGKQWDADTLRRVAAICHDNGMVLLSDEIYGDLMLEGTAHIPTATVSPQAEAVTVTISAPSKTFNVPGIASAWVAIKNPELRRGFFEFLLASEFDTPPVFAITATEAAYTHGEPWLDSLLAYLTANADMAVERLNRIPGVRVVRPDAGFVLWVDFSGLGLSHDALKAFLTDRARVALNDGESFGPGGEGHMRLNIAVPRCRLEQGIDMIARAVAELPTL